MCCVSYRNGIQLTGYQWEVMIGAASYPSISEAQLSASIHSTNMKLCVVSYILTSLARQPYFSLCAHMRMIPPYHTHGGNLRDYILTVSYLLKVNVFSECFFKSSLHLSIDFIK